MVSPGVLLWACWPHREDEVRSLLGAAEPPGALCPRRRVPCPWLEPPGTAWAQSELHFLLSFPFSPPSPPRGPGVASHGAGTRSAPLHPVGAGLHPCVGASPGAGASRPLPRLTRMSRDSSQLSATAPKSIPQTSPGELPAPGSTSAGGRRAPQAPQFGLPSPQPALLLNPSVPAHPVGWGPSSLVCPLRVFAAMPVSTNFALLGARNRSPGLTGSALMLLVTCFLPCLPRCSSPRSARSRERNQRGLGEAGGDFGQGDGGVG